MEYDSRSPQSSMFKRLETFRCCDANTAIKCAFAKRGFYCSGIYHNLRCINCPGILGICNDFETSEELEHDCHQGRTMPVVHVNTNYKRRFDSIQDCNECVIAPPKSRLIYHRYSSTESRLTSFCDTSLHGSLRVHVARLATAGFFYSPGMNDTLLFKSISVTNDMMSSW